MAVPKKKKIKKTSDKGAPVKKKKLKKAPAAAPATAGKKKAPAKKATAGKKKAPAKKATAKKAPAKKNAFGHREGTLTNVMDKLLLKGTTLEDGAKAMVEFKGGDADPKACARQIKTHIKYLQDKKDAVITFGKKSNKYKAVPKDA